jgi:protein MpaA
MVFHFDLIIKSNIMLTSTITSHRRKCDNKRMCLKRTIIPVLILIAFSFLLSGCSEPITLWPLFGKSKSLVAVEYHTIGNSVENRPIECIILGSGKDTTFLLATIHGDEPAGTMLLYKLSQHLQKNPHLIQGRKVILLPVANPDGMAHNTRSNVRGIDLNRNFSTQNRINNEIHGFSPLSEPEAKIIEQLITEYKPNRIVSIHQPFACIDYDGPAVELANMIADLTDLPVEKLGAKSGSLGSFTGVDLGIPTITLELRPDDHHLSERTLWKQYGDSLIQTVIYPNPVRRMGK